MYGVFFFRVKGQVYEVAIHLQGYNAIASFQEQGWKEAQSMLDRSLICKHYSDHEKQHVQARVR